MTIHADEHNDLPEQEHENDGERVGDAPHSLVCLTTYAPSVVLFCGHLYGQLGLLGQRVHDLEGRLDRLGKMVEQQYRRDSEYMAMLAACQRDTANVLNHDLERNALYPAVEAVVGLAEELLHLQDCGKRSLPADGGGDRADKLRQEIDIGCTVAGERLAHIDVKRITPCEGEEFDPKEHVICGYVQTADEGLYGRIRKLVTPGIVYRGKVLRPARVTVFRQDTQQKQE